jgi:FAD/FMN-containing dehydrogenase
LPQDAAAGGTCDLGGYPPKTLKITTVAQVQLAVNFARNTGVRLVVHNTGHDYFGKSIGAGALSIWTNNLKSIDFIAAYSSASSSYTGPAMRLGAGVEVYELYEAANKHGVSALGGECQVTSISRNSK